MNVEAQKELSRKEYWDQRYTQERQDQQDANAANYEWFKTFEKLRPFLTKHLPDTTDVPRILHLVCGTSVSVRMNSCDSRLLSVKSLSADLHDLGMHINSASISPV